jgi:hypothetical protein
MNIGAIAVLRNLNLAVIRNPLIFSFYQGYIYTVVFAFKEILGCFYETLFIIIFFNSGFSQEEHKILIRDKPFR